VHRLFRKFLCFHCKYLQISDTNCIIRDFHSCKNLVCRNHSHACVKDGARKGRGRGSGNEEAARKEQESRKASRAPEILPATTTGRLLFIGS